MTKKCSKCGVEKDLSCFSIRKINNRHRNHCKECVSKYNKNYNKENAEKISKISQEYYKINQEYYIEKQKTYYQNNKEQVNKISNAWKRNKRKTDIAFKLKDKVSASVRLAFKRTGSKKGGSILNYLPYTIQELKEHLEKQFDENMSWENHGIYWHIDHIYPQSLLPYESMEDDNFKKCWALDNLRPLEKVANMKKGNKIIKA